MLLFQTVRALADDWKMSAVTLRVKHSGGQGVVRGLQQTDSLEKLISHSLEALGIDETPGASIRLLAGFPPKVNQSYSTSGLIRLTLTILGCGHF